MNPFSLVPIHPTMSGDQSQSAASMNRFGFPFGTRAIPSIGNGHENIQSLHTMDERMDTDAQDQQLVPNSIYSSMQERPQSMFPYPTSQVLQSATTPMMLQSRVMMQTEHRLQNNPINPSGISHCNFLADYQQMAMKFPHENFPKQDINRGVFFGQQPNVGHEGFINNDQRMYECMSMQRQFEVIKYEHKLMLEEFQQMRNSFAQMKSECFLMMNQNDMDIANRRRATMDLEIKIATLQNAMDEWNKKFRNKAGSSGNITILL